MADGSAIEWTHSTWNPVTGCTKVSTGCDNCYAERFSERFRGVAGHPFENGFDLTLRPERIDQPKHWRRPRLIFVNSMSDLFHKEIPDEFLSRVFDTMETAHWHVYQVLTKRSSPMREFVNRRYTNRPIPPNIWLGVSIESLSVLSRLRHLKQTKAAVRFVSFEPLLGPLAKLDLGGIHWAIAGGESGPGARPVDVAWLRELRDQCVSQNVAFFFKQWGGRTPKSGGNSLDGRQWLQYPKHYKQEYIDLNSPSRVSGRWRCTLTHSQVQERSRYAEARTLRSNCYLIHLRTRPVMTDPNTSMDHPSATPAMTDRQPPLGGLTVSCPGGIG